MADSLETLFKHLGPNTAAMWAGEREALNNYASEASTAHQQQQIQDLLQKHAQNEIMNPLEVQNKQLSIKGLAAELPGKAAMSRRQQMEADTYGATQASNIAKTNSGNQYEVLSNNIKQNDALVDILGKGAAALKKQLPLQRHAFVYDQIEQMAGPQARKVWEERLQSINPNDLPGVIGDMAQHSAMGSVAMRQELAKLAIQTTSQEKIAAGNNAASRYATDQRRETAEARAETDKTKASQIKNLETDIAQNLAKARSETDAEKAAIYYAQATQSAKLKAEITKYGTADIGAVGGIATNPISTLGPVGGNNRQRSPEAQAALEALRKK